MTPTHWVVVLTWVFILGMSMDPNDGTKPASFGEAVVLASVTTGLMVLGVLCWIRRIDRRLAREQAARIRAYNARYPEKALPEED